MSFEKGLSKLERIVKKLESEEIDLETAVADFEEGIKIKNYCEKKIRRSYLSGKSSSSRWESSSFESSKASSRISSPRDSSRSF
jgi:exodeoxyribonuclease VII small subunit